MSKTNKERHIIYLDPSIHKVLKAKSDLTGLSVSDLVNQALCLDMMEDLLNEERLRLSAVLHSSFPVDEPVLHKNI